MAMIFAIGDLVWDVLVKPDGLLLPGGDTTGSIKLAPGGSAANVAAWVARCGAPAGFIGALGADVFGDLIAAADGYGTDSVDSLVSIAERVPTASFFRVVAGAVALLQLFCAQVRCQRDLWVACHAYYHTRFDIIAVLIEVEPPRTSAVMRAFPMRRPPCVAVGEKTCATIVGRDSLVRANGD